MTSDLREIRTSPSGGFEITPHNCFGCGTLNVHGLQMDLHLETARAWTELSLDLRFQGWEGMAHGGIVCTLLDEVMAWSLVAEDNWGVTARMRVDFRKAVPLESPIRADGWVTRSRHRLVETAGRIVDADGIELATAEGTYLAADADRKRELRERYGYRRLDTLGAMPEPVDER